MNNDASEFKKKKILKIKFSELDEEIQKKYIYEIIIRVSLLLISFIFLFFMELELALFIISFALLFLLMSIHSLFLFMAEKVYFLDAKFLGVWEGESKMARVKKRLWTKFIKKQDIICLEAKGEHYLITINKLPPLIVGDNVRIYAVPEAIFKGNDGVYRVSGILHLYKLKNI